MKKFYTIHCFSIFTLLLSIHWLPAQTTIAFQGGEGTPSDNWSFTTITNAGGPIPPGSHITFSEIGGVVNCQRSGLTTFSDFAIALSNTPFAINTLAFEAMPQTDATVALSWDWAEQLAGQFELEREVDEVTTTLGKWEIGNALQQSFHDQTPPSGLLRYRLYHIDQNGGRGLAASDEVWNSGNGNFEPRLWPNPTGDIAHLQLQDEGEWNIAIFQADGMQVLDRMADALSVQKEFTAATLEMHAGIYFIELRNQGKSYQLKLVHK